MHLGTDRGKLARRAVEVALKSLSNLHRSRAGKMTFCQLLKGSADVRVVEKLLVASTASPCAAVVDCGTPAVANNGQDMVDTFSRVVDVCIVHDLLLK